MEIELEDYCLCGHLAAFHDDEVSEYTIKSDKLFDPIKIVKKYQRCNWRDRNGFDYEPYNDSNPNCDCEVFKLDNLRFLARKTDV